jgi:hypothetical protein
MSGFGGAMDKFAAERNTEKLCIRYVSGPRKQNLFSFSDFPKPATIRICSFRSWRLNAKVRSILTWALGGITFYSAHRAHPVRGKGEAHLN